MKIGDAQPAIFSWAAGIFGKATENLIDFTLFLTHIVLFVAAALGCLPCGLHLCTCVLGSKQACAQLACAVVAPAGEAG
jgi:MFS-type transporter involved in bile tolerance (Atg22 family)